MLAARRPYVRASLGPVNANGLVERCRLVAERCVREGALGAVLFIEGGKPHYIAMRKAIRAMVIAGVRDNFRMALVAGTPEDYRTCKYIEAVAARCALQAKVFLDEAQALSWLDHGGSPLAAMRSSRPADPRS
jgi:hypothetical protein